MPLMVIIEVIRRVIRPLTLSVRLAANIVAGHLLLALLMGQASPFGVSSRAVILASIPLIILESAVAIIQSYVFSVLSTLYLSEVA